MKTVSINQEINREDERVPIGMARVNCNKQPPNITKYNVINQEIERSVYVIFRERFVRIRTLNDNILDG